MSTAVLDSPLAPTAEPAPAIAPAPLRMRISAAMRRGAPYHSPGRGHFYRASSRTTCALGALACGLLGPQAFEASVQDEVLDMDWRLDQLVYAHTGVCIDEPLPVLSADPVLRLWLQMRPTAECTLQQAIVYLNDGARWTREAVADWLESLGY